MAKMTYKQFLTKLRDTPRKWRIVGTSIRLRDMCPISSLCGEIATKGYSSAVNLGLPRSLSKKIIYAADLG